MRTHVMFTIRLTTLAKLLASATKITANAWFWSYARTSKAAISLAILVSPPIRWQQYWKFNRLLSLAPFANTVSKCPSFSRYAPPSCIFDSCCVSKHSESYFVVLCTEKVSIRVLTRHWSPQSWVSRLGENNAISQHILQQNEGRLDGVDEMIGTYTCSRKISR